MHPMHPSMAQALCRARAEQLHREAATRRRGRARRRRGPVRTTAGWFLINVGFRLALPEPSLGSISR